MLEYFNRPSVGTSDIICSQYFLTEKELRFKGLWVYSSSGSPVSDYAAKSAIWNLHQDLSKHKVSELCRQNKWEF